MQALQQLYSYKDRSFLRIENWVMLHINRPIKGFEHKQNPDGSLYTKTQQIISTRYQAMAIAIYFIGRGKSEDEVLKILEVFS